MVPSLVDIFERLQEALPDVSMALGQEYVDANVAPPYIVLVPSDDEDAPMSRSDPLNIAQRTVGTILAGVDCVIWGAGTPDDTHRYEHVRATEALRNRFLFAVHQVATGAYRRLGGKWADTSVEQYGRGYLQRLQFMLPIVDPLPPTTTATITATTAEGGQVYPASVVITPTPAP